MLPTEPTTSSLPCIDVYPLSSPQLDIYYDHLMKGGTPAYHIGGYLDFAEPLDVERFALSRGLGFHPGPRARQQSKNRLHCGGWLT